MDYSICLKCITVIVIEIACESRRISGDRLSSPRNRGEKRRLEIRLRLQDIIERALPLLFCLKYMNKIPTPKWKARGVRNMVGWYTASLRSGMTGHSNLPTWIMHKESKQFRPMED